jgi:hypothetical protein
MKAALRTMQQHIWLQTSHFHSHDILFIHLFFRIPLSCPTFRSKMVASQILAKAQATVAQNTTRASRTSKVTIKTIKRAIVNAGQCMDVNFTLSLSSLKIYVKCRLLYAALPLSDRLPLPPATAPLPVPRCLPRLCALPLASPLLLPRPR